ncbi:hypothetical protein AAMO2058_001497700 [Amorphochlora amoebiformis]
MAPRSSLALFAGLGLALLLLYKSSISAQLGRSPLAPKTTRMGRAAIPHRQRRNPNSQSKNVFNSKLNAMAMGKLPAAIIAIQSVGLVGATVTGYLARRRRDEIHTLNEQLRTINQELRNREKNLIEKEAVLHYMQKREIEMAKTEAADELSPDERSLFSLIENGKNTIEQGSVEDGIATLKLAIETADKQNNLRYSINSRRELSSAYQKIDEPQDALNALLEAYEISESTDEAIHSRVALCGEIADVYTDLGDLKTAAEFYDRWIMGM